MKKLFLLSLLIITVQVASYATDFNLILNKPLDSTKIQVFKDIVYFDGYAPEVKLEVKEGLIRNNTTYTRKLELSEINLLKQGEIKMQVDLVAACDNYDRLAHVSVLFSPQGKGPEFASQKIELGRYITPFMDKNKNPNIRPYIWEQNALADILSNKELLKQTDVYIQMHVFGVPYDAQKKVKGCEGRNDVFVGNLSFTVYPQKSNTAKIINPIAHIDSINNYNSTDTLGKTTRSYDFQVPKNLKSAELYIISSNHGANRGGEEYSRRIHYVYLDNKLIFEYKPGEDTCEPYRMYNTQNNGIYGRTEKTEAQWQAFSNWCPGAAIPLRKVHLKQIKRGKHQLRISVPDAKFVDKQGTIPFSAYLIGK